MCGLAGFASTEKDTVMHQDVLTELLYANALRGMDATGVGGIARRKEGFESVLYKRALSSPEFIQLKGYEKLILDNMKDLSVCIGHTRHKTYGKHVDDDAHPFRHGKIMLAHNGSLTSKGGLKDWDEAVIDSENIAINMSKYPEQEVLEGIYGAAALVWFNGTDGSVNFSRNKERPLAIAYEEKKNTIYWASEPVMLQSVLERNGVDVEFIAVIKTGLHFKIYLDDIRKRTVVPFKNYTPPVAVNRVSDIPWVSRGGLGERSRNRRNTATPDELLAELYLKRDERIPVRFTTYEDTQTPNNPDHKRGKIYGYYARGVKIIPVVLYNTNKKTFDKVGQGNYGLCEIKGAYVDIKQGGPAVIATFKEKIKPGQIVLPHEYPPRKAEPTDGTGAQIYWPTAPDFRPKTNPPHGFAYGPGEKLISVERFLALTDDGCTACGKNISASENADIFWTTDQTPRPICRRCEIDHCHPIPTQDDTK